MVSQEVEEILEEVKPVSKSIENASSTKQSGLEQVEFKSLSAIKNQFPTGGRELSRTPKQVKVTPGPTSVVEREDPVNRRNEKEGTPQPILETPKPKTVEDRGIPIPAKQQQVSQSQPEPKVLH